MNQTFQKISRPKEVIVEMNQQGRIWIKMFFSILRNSQVHDPGNEIFKEPISRMLESENKILQREGKAEFRILDDQFFLNGLWIKPIISERDNLFLCSDLLKKNGLGGITIQSNTQEGDWRKFLSVFQSSKESIDLRSRNMNQELSSLGNESIVCHPILSLQDEREINLPLSPVPFAAVTAYAKALLILREMREVGSPDEWITSFRKTQRIVCDLIDVMDKAPKLFSLLSLLKEFEEYPYHHGVNTMVLSLLLSQEMGFGKRERVDVGMASLLHDIGRFKISEETLRKPDPLTEEEWKKIYSHPMETTKIFLTLGPINSSIFERALVSFQHHWAFFPQEGYPKPRRNLRASVMSQIVSLCVRYDAMISEKPYRKALEPYEAIGKLIQEFDEKSFSKEIFYSFLKMMGPTPIGCWMEIPDGRRGMVVISGKVAQKNFFPLLWIPESQEWIEASSEAKIVPAGEKEKQFSIGSVFRHYENSPLKEK